MLVVAVIGFSAVLGIAMLSTSAVQAQVTLNSARVAVAEGVAESGLNLAMYYLQNRSAAPSALQTVLLQGGTWQDSNLAMSSPGEGTISLSITRVTGSSTLFDVSSIGYASPGTVTSPSRTLSARVQVTLSPYALTQAGLFNGALTVPSRTTITGDIQLTGALTRGGGGATRGAVTGTSTVVSTSPSPLPTEIQKYADDVYWYGSPPKQYSVTLINSATLPLGTYGPTTSNPLGVYRYTGSSLSTFTMSSLTTVNGTLIVPGRLAITGTSNTVNAPSGYPGLIVGKDIYFGGTVRSLTVNGLVYSGTGVNAAASSLGSTFTVNGAILMPTPNFGSGTRTVNINFDSTRLSLVDFAPRLQTPTAVRLIDWSE